MIRNRLVNALWGAFIGDALGMLLGASQGIDTSLQKGLVHYEALDREIESFADVILSGEGHLVV